MFPAADTLVPVARVLKSYGTGGNVMISFSSEMSEYLSNNEEPVFLFHDGLPVPFFFESFQIKGVRKAIVALTGICSLEAAEEIVGMDLFLDPARHPELQDSSATLLSDGEYDISLDDLVGYTIYDAGQPATSTDEPESDHERQSADSRQQKKGSDSKRKKKAGKADNPADSYKNIGKIASVSDYSGNVCFELETGTIIPFHEDLLAGIDPESQSIILHIPAGLL